jgi:HSP20 family molecular chaperone IbpA
MNTVTQTRDTAPAEVQRGQRSEPAERSDAALLPPVDVIEDATGITLYADMPGVAKDRVQLRVEAEQLTIEGEMALTVPPGMEATHAEVRRSRFHRAFTLSKELDADKVSAEMNHGVLRVRIPKAAHAQPRRVQVQVG